MKDMFPPNINPSLFSLSAVIVGQLLISDFNVYEQNAIGNWLFLVGQYILTNSSQQQLIETRMQGYSYNINKNNNIDILYEAINKISIELEKIKNS